jgi:hypothetical protein
MRASDITPITLKVVGYLDFATAKVYKTKAALTAAITERTNKTVKAVNQAAKSTKDYLKEVATNIMQGQVLGERLLKAKKLLRAKFTFERQKEYLTALRLFSANLEGYLSIC